MLFKLSLIAIAGMSHVYFFGAYMMRAWLCMQYRIERHRAEVTEGYEQALAMADAHMKAAFIIGGIALAVFFVWFILGRGESQSLWDWLLGINYYRY